ncbi:hypothetical protein HZY91_07600 [Facklamia sp. DSM 111018]|uniref:Enkurin domain-containing protein n=1 Tax=Facklamia lactis TaxID=2749967 RepID=A0ABS0LTH7_9LACT|nr:hypothetical protein [Facklamia lactis]MBG9980877.1 hypothetical protein [Facklamia lactis]MBG9986760.1 hypothetical protein [Facklamia lactis]
MIKDGDYQGPVFYQNKKSKVKRDFRQGMTRRSVVDRSLEEPAIHRKHPQAGRNFIKNQAEERDQRISSEEADPTLKVTNEEQIPFLKTKKNNEHLLQEEKLIERLNERSKLDLERQKSYNDSLPRSLSHHQELLRSQENREIDERLDNIDHSLETVGRIQAQYRDEEKKLQVNREVLLRLIKDKESFLLFE